VTLSVCASSSEEGPRALVVLVQGPAARHTMVYMVDKARSRGRMHALHPRGCQECAPCMRPRACACKSCRAEAAGWAGRCWQPGKIGASCGLRIRTASSRMLRGCRSMVHGLAVGVSQACWQLACSKRAGSLESHYCSSVPASSVLAAPHLWILGGVPLLHRLQVGGRQVSW
jgi:hypothetical protein